VDDEGKLWLSQASAVLPWAAAEDGSGSYSGEVVGSESDVWQDQNTS
jgi:hypothetical protein